MVVYCTSTWVASAPSGPVTRVAFTTKGAALQVSGSVRWEESMLLLLRDGFDTFVELGSGDVLAGLLRRIDKSARTYSVQDADSLQAACGNLIQ